MRPFTYVRASDAESALRSGGEPDALFLAGGTTLVDLLRLDVLRPRALVDINPLPLRQIEATNGGVRIGAMARNTEIAYHPLIVARYPVLSQALLSGASPQLRNMATLGGNLLQRTRCSYFRDVAAACNKRTPGSGCAALEGYTRMHAVLGTSPHCIAAHPSDMCVALVMLDAVIHTRGPEGERAIPMEELHTLPGEHPEIETVLRRGELITHVDLPSTAFLARSRYVKVRDRASYAFALTAAAVALELQGKTIKQARVALGGVGTRPWRCRAAEAALVGQPATLASYRKAAALALQGAAPRRDNQFKVELAQRTLVRALQQVGGEA